MKHLLKLLSVVAVVALFAPIAKADPMNQISFQGTSTYNTNGNVTFNAPSSATLGGGNATVGGVSTGIFSSFVASNATPGFKNTYVDFMNFNAKSASTFELFTATDPSGNILDFFVTSQALTMGTGGPEDIGMGYYTLNGARLNLVGTFDMTTQGAAGTSVTFSDTNSVTPEPSSLMLLGTGLVSAAGMLVRRRRTVVA